MQTLRILLIALFLVPAAAWSAPQERQTPPDLRFQEAWYREIGEGRVEEALALYREIADAASNPAALRARALFRVGICLGKLQRAEEAIQVYRRILDEFPEETEAANQARLMIQGETEADAAFRDKVESLIALLGDKNPEVRQDARRSIRNIGLKTTPFLFNALARGTYYQSEESARILCHFADGHPEILDSIATAIRTGDEIVANNLKNAMGGMSERALARLADDPSVEVRTAAVSTLREKPWTEGVEAITHFLDDGDPGVRRAAMASLGGLIASNEIRVEALRVVPAGLADPDDTVREAAARAMRDLMHFRSLFTRHPEAADAAVRRLVPLIGDRAEGVESAAVAALAYQQQRFSSSIIPGARSDHRVFWRLAGLAKDPARASSTRRNAVVLLGRFERPETAPEVVHALLDTDRDVVLEAIDALQRIGDPVAVTPLVDKLRSTKDTKIQQEIMRTLTGELAGPESRVTLIENLTAIPDTWADNLIGQVRYDRTLALAAMDQFDSLGVNGRAAVLDIIVDLQLREGIPVVMRSLEDPEIQSVAMDAAKMLQDPDLLPPLLALLDDADARTRERSADILLKIRDPRATGRLVELLRDPNLSVAQSVAGGLRNRYDARIATGILEVLPDVQLPILQRTLEILYNNVTPEMGAEVARSLDESFLAPHTNRIQSIAISILRKAESEDGLPTIRYFLRDEDHDVRAAAVSSLASIGGSAVISEVAAMLEDPNSSVRGEAVEALGATGDPAVLVYLAPMVERAIASGTMARTNLLKALVRLEVAETVPLIVKLHEGIGRGSKMTLVEGGREREIRKFVHLWSLLEFPPEPAIDGLRSIMYGEFEVIVKMDAVRVLARVQSPRAGEEILKLLDHENAFVRTEAVYAVGRTLNPEFLPRLVERLLDPDDRVRAAARSAIEEIRFYLEQKEYAEKVKEGGR